MKRSFQALASTEASGQSVHPDAPAMGAGVQAVQCLARLEAWRRAAPGRRLFIASRIVGMAQGDRSIVGTGVDQESAARDCWERWAS